MRTLITTRALLLVGLVGLAGACAGKTPADVDSGRACARKLYDLCRDEHDCDSGVCRNFGTYEACSQACTVGNDASCMTTLDGMAATCTAGVCTPHAANSCVLL